MATKVTKKVMKAVKKETKRVKQNNEIFDKSTPAEKRVLIAKDVISGLKKKKLISTPGCWVSNNANYGDLFDMDKVDPDTELKTILDKIPSCNVCALGGIFVSTVKRFDKLKCKDEFAMPDIADFLPYLKKFFSEKQLNLIECAYEIGEGWAYDDGESKSMRNARAFGESFGDSTERMVAIMKNIVKNDGLFVPPVAAEEEDF
jgi:hypothetical protein